MVNRIRDSKTTPSPADARKQGSSMLKKALPSDLLARDEKYRGFFQEAVLGMFQTTQDGRFVDANDALAHMLGYESRDELIASVTDIGRQVHVDPERRAEFRRLLEEQGAVKGFEARARRNDGNVIWLSLTARRVESAPGSVIYEGIAEDITDRKAVEDALRSSEERFYKAFHASPAAKSIVSAGDRRFIDVNDQFLAMLGYTRDEVIGRTADDLGMWGETENRDRLRMEIEKAGIARNLEATLLAKDGSPREVLGSAVVIHVEGELCILALLHDITERKKAENELRESERRFRELVQALGVAVYVTDAEGHITLYNEAAVDLWGRRPDTSKDRWCGSYKLFHIDGTPMKHEECPMAVTVRGNHPVRDMELIAERPDGSRCIIVPYPTPLRDAGGNVRGAVNILVDITDRKKAEAALLEREGRLSAIVNTAADGIIAIDSSGVIQAFNAAASRIFGYSEEEIRGKKINLLMPEPYASEHDSYIERYLKTGVARIIGVGREVEGRRKDGSTFPLELSVSEVLVDGAKTFTGIVRDITERKRIENSLADERQRLELAMQAGRMGTWEWDINTGAVHWSDTLHELHGINPGEFGGTFEDYTSDWHPEDRQRVLGSLRRALETGSHELEYRIIWPDGSEHWVSAKGHLIRDAAGKPERMIGLCMDVTARKGSEEADRFLSDASAMFAATTTDFEMTVASLARLSVPYLGDLCSVVILDEMRQVRQTAVNHRRAPRTRLARLIEERYPVDPDRPVGVGEVLRTGKAVLYRDVTDAMLEKAAKDEHHLKLLRRLGIRSAMVVPLLARGRTLGSVTFAITESGRHYTEADLALAEDLGRRAGLAIDNATLYNELGKALEAKDEFLGLMSHELRTPITTIYGGARMIRSRGDRLEDEQRDRLMADIEQESERLFRMVEDLLALARVELGQAPSTEPILLQRTIEKTASAFGQRRSGRPLELDLEDDLPPVAAQAVYVEQVVRNLLSNADKYSPAGLPVLIRARRGDGGVDVSVVDRGPGIASEETELIFERFYRSNEAPRLASGAGLGLTVCKRLIEAQGGRVWARPNDFGGLEVGFSLPLYQEET